MNEKVIWDYLYSKIGNIYGVAGLMGNLYVESHLDPKCLESSFIRKSGISRDEYIQSVDDGSYSLKNFTKDGAGFGLAQWTYSTRKEKLYEFAKKSGVSIADLSLQLDYLWAEIQTYKTVVNVLKTAGDVRTASDIVVKRYEKPKNQSEAYLENRAKYGQSYLISYGKQGELKCVKANVTVNLRSGNSKSYSKIGEMKKGETKVWVATSENNWYAVEHNDVVAWVSGEFSQLI